MIRLRTCLTVLFLLGATAALAESSFRFLSMERGPRNAAMAGAGTAETEGRVEDAPLNPAGLAWAARPEAWSSVASLMGDARLTQAAYGFPTLRHGGFALRVLHLGQDPIDAYDSSDARAGSLKPASIAGALAWGREWRPGWAAGAAVKAFREDLGAASAAGEALDLGVAWQSAALPGLSLGAAARNLGAGARFDRETEDLPGVVALGASYDAFSHRLRVNLDAEKGLADDGTKLGLGGEYWVRDLLALRAGHYFEKDGAAKVTLGLGLKLSRGASLDYSFTPMDDLEDAHRVALGYRFGGGKAQALYEEGLSRLRAEDYTEAVLLFDKALTLDPHHTAAARRLKEAAEKLKASEK